MEGEECFKHDLEASLIIRPGHKTAPTHYSIWLAKAKGKRARDVVDRSVVRVGSGYESTEVHQIHHLGGKKFTHSTYCRDEQRGRHQQVVFS